MLPVVRIGRRAGEQQHHRQRHQRSRHWVAAGGKDHKTVTQYKAAYTDGVYGPVSCSGTHHAATTSGVAAFDSFTCTSTSGSPLTNLAPGQTFTVGWVSDFNGASASNFTGTVSADGMSYTATATY